MTENVQLTEDTPVQATEKIIDIYKNIRTRTEKLCSPLQTEDYVVQPIVDVSPPKWHLGHTTWFFETFLLKPYLKDYKEFNPNFNFVFNSYYETIGARVIRTDRGNLSRPTVSEVYNYRRYIDEKMLELIENVPLEDFEDVLMLGLNHEQQHQELLLTDIKYILGHNPLFPEYSKEDIENIVVPFSSEFIPVQKGLYHIGCTDNGFCFDNELAVHQVHLENYEIAKELITNREYLEFIEDGGYDNFSFWHSEGWEWAKSQAVKAPMYWHFIDGKWFNYTLHGLKPVSPDQPVCHINYYEASAFAEWKGMRLPTEFEWEAASNNLSYGTRWEWTESAHLPYPGYKKATGAIGEYNGKFMINQMVLRGHSIATPKNHARISYRNFFHPHLRWQYTGIRLAKKQV
jgi:ergothioneine biosynthesis protein EgtB